MMNLNAHGFDQDGFDGSLCDADAQALDALAACGFDIEQVAPEIRERAEHVARVLGLLEKQSPAAGSGMQAGRAHGSEADGVLIDVTLARVARARSERPVQTHLCDDDHDAMELLVGSGYAAERVPGGVRTRARKQMELLSLLDTLDGASSVDGRERLVSKTLARVQSTIDGQETRMLLESSPSKVRRRGLSELISVAAMLLLGGAVLVPMVSAMREYGRRAECQSNMMAAGLGFGAYAKDFREMLPLASESRAGTEWWRVGDPSRSNSANLFTLARTSYAKLSDLACAGNPEACASPESAGAMDWRSINQVSYSYQNMFAVERTRWTQPSTVVVIADRSPIIPLAMLGQAFDPMANSLNHEGRGQTVLFNDGSSRFLRTPVLEHKDNIYLPRILEEAIARQNDPNRGKPLNGKESPGSADDSFVGP
jgi:hypothetical protein